MNCLDNKRIFNPVPVLEGIPPYREDKGTGTPILELKQQIDEFITVPALIINPDSQYIGRLVYQYNVEFHSDFYIVNAQQLVQLAALTALHGCVCIKFTFGTITINGTFYNIVNRYKLMDSLPTFPWNSFIPYTNQLIRKNFVIEFFTLNANGTNTGIVNPFNIQTSNIGFPIDTGQSDSFNGVGPSIQIADFGHAFPINLPINNFSQAPFNNS